MKKVAPVDEHFGSGCVPLGMIEKTLPPGTFCIYRNGDTALVLGTPQWLLLLNGRLTNTNGYQDLVAYWLPEKPKV